MAAMRADGRSQIHEDIELLQLTGARDGQQALDSVFPVPAAIAKADLAPLNGVAQRAFRHRMPRPGLCRVLQFSPGRIASRRAANAA